MTSIDQYRDNPDLIDMIARLQNRVERLERGRRLGNSSIDNGEFTVRNGDIVVRDPDDNEQLRLTHGYSPSLRLFSDTATDANQIRLRTYSTGGMTVGELMARNSVGNGDGGKLLVSRGWTYLSHQPIGAEETFLGLSLYTDYPNHFTFRGKWIMDDQIADWNALYMGTANVVAGFSGLSWSYDFPYTTTPLLMYSVSGAAANFSHAITAQSTTGFTISWSDALAHTVHFQVWRR